VRIDFASVLTITRKGSAQADCPAPFSQVLRRDSHAHLIVEIVRAPASNGIAKQRIFWSAACRPARESRRREVPSRNLPVRRESEVSDHARPSARLLTSCSRWILDCVNLLLHFVKMQPAARTIDQVTHPPTMPQNTIIRKPVIDFIMTPRFPAFQRARPARFEKLLANPNSGKADGREAMVKMTGKTERRSITPPTPQSAEGPPP